MTSNWLQQIYEVLTQYHDILEHISEVQEEIDSLLTALDPIIREMNGNIDLIQSDVADILVDTDAINTNTSLIKGNTDDIKTDLGTIKNNDIAHYLAEEQVLDAIKTLAQTISNNAAVIKDKTTLIQSDVYGIKHDTGIILNSNQAIATATGQCPALLNDIATNTLNTDDRVALISADTTEIIAVLRQIRDTIQNHWNPTP